MHCLWVRYIVVVFSMFTRWKWCNLEAVYKRLRLAYCDVYDMYTSTKFWHGDTLRARKVCVEAAWLTPSMLRCPEIGPARISSCAPALIPLQTLQLRLVSVTKATWSWHMPGPQATTPVPRQLVTTTAISPGVHICIDPPSTSAFNLHKLKEFALKIWLKMFSLLPIIIRSVILMSARCPILATFI